MPEDDSFLVLEDFMDFEVGFASGEFVAVVVVVELLVLDMNGTDVEEGIVVAVIIIMEEEEEVLVEPIAASGRATGGGG